MTYSPSPQGLSGSRKYCDWIVNCFFRPFSAFERVAPRFSFHRWICSFEANVLECKNAYNGARLEESQPSFLSSLYQSNKLRRGFAPLAYIDALL